MVTLAKWLFDLSELNKRDGQKHTGVIEQFSREVKPTNY